MGMGMYMDIDRGGETVTAGHDLIGVRIRLGAEPDMLSPSGRACPGHPRVGGCLAPSAALAREGAARTCPAMTERAY
jgi:hypothetical protein